MNTQEVETLIAGVIAGIFSAVLFIYLSNYIIGALKTSGPKRFGQKIRGFDSSDLKSNRKKIVWKPNVVCSLPIYEKGRPEAPLF